MFSRLLPLGYGLVLGFSMMMAAPAAADPLKDEIAPTGKLRVAIAISPAGGAFWSSKTEGGGYAGVPVDLGKEMAAQHKPWWRRVWRSTGRWEIAGTLPGRSAF